MSRAYQLTQGSQHREQPRARAHAQQAPRPTGPGIREGQILVLRSLPTGREQKGLPGQTSPSQNQARRIMQSQQIRMQGPALMWDFRTIQNLGHTTIPSGRSYKQKTGARYAGATSIESSTAQRGVKDSRQRWTGSGMFLKLLLVRCLIWRLIKLSVVTDTPP